MGRKVYGFHRVNLRPSVDPLTFERFALEQFLPALNALNAPGVEFHVLKADRGVRESEFIFMMVFDDVETRDRYFPQPDHPSDELIALIRPLQSLSQIWEGLSAREKTDYVQLD
jgi:hypothetical protein